MLQFWNFKTELTSETGGDLARQWYVPTIFQVSCGSMSFCLWLYRSYLEGVKRGYLTKDPSKVHDPHVCDEYIM